MEFAGVFIFALLVIIFAPVIKKWAEKLRLPLSMFIERWQGGKDFYLLSDKGEPEVPPEFKLLPLSVLLIPLFWLF